MTDEPTVSAEPCSPNASLLDSADHAPDNHILEFLQTFEVDCMLPPRYTSSHRQRFVEYITLKGNTCKAAYEMFEEYTPETVYTLEDIEKTMNELKLNFRNILTTKESKQFDEIIEVRGYEAFLFCGRRMMENMPLSVRLLLRKVSIKLRELVLDTSLNLDEVELELAEKEVKIKAGDCQIHYQNINRGVAISSGCQKVYDEELDMIEHAGRDLKTILEHKNLTVNKLKILEGAVHFNPHHTRHLHRTLGFLDGCNYGKPKIKHLSFDYATLLALRMILDCMNVAFLESIELVDAKRPIYTGIMRIFDWEKMKSFKTFATNMVMDFKDVKRGLPHLDVMRCSTTTIVTVQLVQEMIDILLGCEPTLEEVYIQTNMDDVTIEVYYHYKDLMRNPNVTEYFFSYPNHPEHILVMVLTADTIQFRGPNFNPTKERQIRERKVYECFCRWGDLPKR